MNQLGTCSYLSLFMVTVFIYTLKIPICNGEKNQQLLPFLSHKMSQPVNNLKEEIKSDIFETKCYSNLQSGINSTAAKQLGLLLIFKEPAIS